MVRADENNGHDAGLIVGIAPRVTGAILNHRVPCPKFAFYAVVELEHAAPGHNELIINRRSPTMTKAEGTITRIDGLRGLWRAVLVTKGPTGYHIAGGASVAA
jgi:hypothetical protein